jgi:hypothetical protein
MHSIYMSDFIDGQDIFHFHRQDEAGERKCDAVAEPDRRSISQHAVKNPEASTGLNQRSG